MLEGIRRFVISADFYKSLTFVVAALLPIVILSIFFSRIELGFAIALGVVYNSSTNSPGSVKHRTVGMCVSILLTTLATIIIGYAALNIWVLLPILGLVTFSISYLSVYGFRASLVSLSALLAVVISFAHSYVHLSVIDYALLVFLGGLWYLLVSSIANYFNPKMYVEELLSDTMKLTGAFLETRAKLLSDKNNRKELNVTLFKLQAELSEKHETLRDVILTNRQKSGLSNRIRRKRLLFIELVDMLELAIANPVDYERVDVVFKNKEAEYIAPFIMLINEMAAHLDTISKVILRDEKVNKNIEIPVLLKKVKTALNTYKENEDLNATSDGFFILTNLYEYQTAQVQKIKAIQRVLNILTSNNSLTKETNGDTRFLTPQDYGWNKLVVNFSLKSSIFRHSLRLSIVMVVGYLLGYVFSVQNPYWILLTIVVIMRPSYGLTKQRMKHRILGTLFGGIAGLILVYFIHDRLLIGFLAAFSLLIAQALVKLNYRMFAMFTTLHIVFLYALFSPNIMEVIQYRIIDTLAGGSLAILANLFLFPSWEFMTVQDSVLEALTSNSDYLGKIEKIYKTKTSNFTEYKLARKRSFLAMGDLNASFQRMTQEPKSRQKYFSDIYDIVALMNTFLSSVTSLGTYIRSHKTTEFSEEISVFVKAIIHNLETAKQRIAGESISEKMEVSEIDEAKTKLQNKYMELSKSNDEFNMNVLGNKSNSLEISSEIQESKLVLEQLSYLYSLSKNIIKKVSNYQDKIDQL